MNTNVEIGSIGAAAERPARWGAAVWAGARIARPNWTHAALAAIAALSAFLGFFRLGREGDANAYYAAAVRSMLDNWHAFFFASLDRVGFVTVDKPPLGLWIQTASAKLFGFHGWSILLPEVLATVGSVLILFVLVRRAFGPTAGLLAALALAVAPINVAVARNNTSDSLLVCTLLLAALAVTIAAERGSWRWLLAGMALVGLGFNIKMLQAYLVLPALLLVYLLTAAVPWRTRIRHLALGVGVLLVVSFSWATVVALTPASARPYVGSSSNNSIFNLIFGYNGLNRLLPRGWSIFGITGGSSGVAGGFGGGGVGGVSENGPQGLFRLLDTQLGGQIGWLLPLAVLGLVWGLGVWGWGLGKVGGWRFGRMRQQGRRPDLLSPTPDPQALLSPNPQTSPAPNPQPPASRALVLWGGWLATQGAFFSVAGFYHRYYLSMLSPAIAALAGAGVIALWHGYRAGGWRAWLLPAALVVSAASEIRILRDYPAWRDRLAPAIVVLTAVAVLGLVVGRFGILARFGTARAPRVLVAAAVVALLIAPTAWSGITVADANAGGLPSAGPSAVGGGGPFGGGPGRGSFAGGQPPAGFALAGNGRGPNGGQAGGPGGPGDGVSSGLLAYLTANQGNATYLVAVRSASEAAPIILQTNKAVMAMGGFSGNDPILTVASFKQLVAKGEVRFVLGGGFGGPGGGNASAPVNDWIQQTCTVVSASAYSGSTSASASTTATGSGFGFDRAQTLYDCKGAASK